MSLTDYLVNFIECKFVILIKFKVFKIFIKCELMNIYVEVIYIYVYILFYIS